MLLLLSTLFIVSLTWHVSYPSNILVFGFMALMLIFYMKNPFPLQARTIYFIITFLLLMVLFLIFNLTLHETFSYDKISSYIKKISFALLLFIFVLLFYKDRKELLFKSIDYALIVIVSLWYLQLATFYITGNYLDLLEPLIGQPQRYQAYFASNIDFIIRPTSLFTEPGTYAVNTFPLLVLSYLHHRKMTKVQLFTLISYFASFSLFAIIIATLFIMVAEFSRFKWQLSRKNIIMFTLLALILIGVERYIYFRFILENNVGAVGLRESVIQYWLSLDSMGILFGQGNAQTHFLNYTIDDTSFFFKLIYEYGILSIPFFIVLIYLFWGLPLFFLFILLLTKLTYLLYIFWFFLAATHLTYTQKKPLS